MSDALVLDRSALERLRRMGGADLVRRMVELYLANAPERMRTLSDAAAAEDAAGVERAAHMMKSSAGNLGAVRLQRTAEALEAVAADGNVDAQLVERLLSDMEASIVALRNVLEEEHTS
jgi:HPt (histidine-containing phosphotransfer) domain-containing protein